MVYSEEIALGFDADKKEILASKMVEHIFADNDLGKISFRAVTRDMCSQQNLEGYYQSLHKKVYSILLDTEKESIEDDISFLIALRDKLLTSGGFSNISSSLLISYAVNGYFLKRISEENAVNPQLILKNIVTDKVIQDCFKKGFHVDKCILSFPSSLPSGSKKATLLRQIFSVNEKEIGVTIKFKDWHELEADDIQLGCVPRKVFNSNYSSLLFNWSHVLDEQFAIKLLNDKCLSDPLFISQESSIIKKELDKEILKMKEPVMLKSLEIWKGRRVYDFYRKFMHLSSSNSYEERLKSSLVQF